MKKEKAINAGICESCNKELSSNDWIGVCSKSERVGCRWCMKNEKGRIQIKSFVDNIKEKDRVLMSHRLTEL